MEDFNISFDDFYFVLSLQVSFFFASTAASLDLVDEEDHTNGGRDRGPPGEMEVPERNRRGQKQRNTVKHSLER